MRSPFKLGYAYYDDWKEAAGRNVRTENILVHKNELEIEFRKHLSDLKHLLIHHYYEGHKMWDGKKPKI